MLRSRRLTVESCAESLVKPQTVPPLLRTLSGSASYFLSVHNQQMLPEAAACRKASTDLDNGDAEGAQVDCGVQHRGAPLQEGEAGGRVCDACRHCSHIHSASPDLQE